MHRQTLRPSPFRAPRAERPRRMTLVVITLLTLCLAAPLYTGWPSTVSAVGIAREVFHAEAQPGK